MANLKCQNHKSIKLVKAVPVQIAQSSFSLAREARLLTATDFSRTLPSVFNTALTEIGVYLRTKLKDCL